MKTSVLVLLLAACGSKGSAVHDYKLLERADRPQPEVPVRISVPGSWAESKDNLGAPTFEPAGKDTMFPSVAVLLVGCPDGSKGAECIDKRIAVEFREKVERTDKGGATWIVEPNPKSGGATAERLVYDAPSGDLVKCFVVYSKDDDAAAMRGACDSLVVRP